MTFDEMQLTAEQSRQMGITAADGKLAWLCLDGFHRPSMEVKGWDWSYAGWIVRADFNSKGLVKRYG